LGDQGEKAGEIGVDEKGNDIERNVNEELMPAVGFIGRVSKGNNP